LAEKEIGTGRIAVMIALLGLLQLILDKGFIHEQNAQ